MAVSICLRVNAVFHFGFRNVGFQFCLTIFYRSPKSFFQKWFHVSREVKWRWRGERMGQERNQNIGHWIDLHLTYQHIGQACFGLQNFLPLIKYINYLWFNTHLPVPVEICLVILAKTMAASRGFSAYKRSIQYVIVQYSLLFLYLQLFFRN